MTCIAGSETMFVVFLVNLETYWSRNEQRSSRHTGEINSEAQTERIANRGPLSSPYLPRVRWRRERSACTHNPESPEESSGKELFLFSPLGMDCNHSKNVREALKVIAISISSLRLTGNLRL